MERSKRKKDQMNVGRALVLLGNVTIKADSLLSGKTFFEEALDIGNSMEDPGIPYSGA